MLSLQVKTVIPKPFPLGQINRFYALLLRMLWLIVWLSTEYCSPGTVRTFCSQHRMRKQSLTAQPCQPLWPGDWSVRAQLAADPRWGTRTASGSLRTLWTVVTVNICTWHICRLMHIFSFTFCCCCYGIFFPVFPPWVFNIIFPFICSKEPLRMENAFLFGLYLEEEASLSW